MESTVPRFVPTVGMPETGREGEVKPSFLVDPTEIMGDNGEIFPPTAEQRRQRIVQLIEHIAPLVASLSAELCKEDHGRFMTVAAKVEEAAIIIEANITELEATAGDGQMPARPGTLLRFIALFHNRAQQLVQAYAHLSRQRDRQLEALGRLRKQLAALRDRPVRVHQEAVDHVKRLLLYEDSRVKDLQRLLGDTSEALAIAENKNYYSDRSKALRDAVAALKEQMPRLEAEAADKALRLIQESDNGKRVT